MKNIVFDADVLSNKFTKNSSRSGIFFVANNILIELSKNKNYNVSLYFKNEDLFLKYYNEFINDAVYNKFKIYNNFNKQNLFKKIELVSKFEGLKFKKKETKNIIKKNLLRLELFFLKKIVNFYKQKDFFNNFKNIDFFLSPVFAIPNEVAKNDKIGKAIILYDTIPDIFPEIYFTGIDRKTHWYTQMTQKLNKNLYCLCISNSSKNDFFSRYGNNLDPNKMLTMHLATSQELSPEKDQKKLNDALNKYNIPQNLRGQYIFSLCTLEPRKNLIFTVKCFVEFLKKNKIDNLYFYLAGGQYDSFMKKLEEEIDNLDEYKDKIVKLGYVDDEDINTLINNSLFLTYISKYEGFGIPPLEAMSCGIPVLTSNMSSLPEVVGNAAIMINPTDKKACIKAMEDLYFNENLRNELSKKGLEQAKKFSWTKSTEVINKIINKENLL